MKASSGAQAAAGILSLVALLVGSSTAWSQTDENAVEARIVALQTTWNRGDMAGYLANYHQDESLVLTFGNTVIEGWEALDVLFRQSYPDPERMGRFAIERLDVQVLGPDAAIAYGNFTHVFPSETVKGGFSHVLTRSADGTWLIRHERTSRGEVIHAE